MSCTTEPKIAPDFRTAAQGVPTRCRIAHPSFASDLDHGNWHTDRPGALSCVGEGPFRYDEGKMVCTKVFRCSVRATLLGAGDARSVLPFRHFQFDVRNVKRLQ